MEQNEQFAALIAGKTERRDVSAREVENGFIISAQRRWTEPSTGLAVAQLQSETIATSHADAAARIANFLAQGEFGAPAA